MDLIERVVTELGVSEDRAVQGVGGLFVAIRMAVDAKSFTKLTAAFPDAGRWMQHAPFKSGRTGEMLAIVTPGAVQRTMRIAGFTDEQIPHLGGIVGRAIQDHLDGETYGRLAETLPILRAA